MESGMPSNHVTSIVFAKATSNTAAVVDVVAIIAMAAKKRSRIAKFVVSVVGGIDCSSRAELETSVTSCADNLDLDNSGGLYFFRLESAMTRRDRRINIVAVTLR